jgi:hypothetical protein
LGDGGAFRGVAVLQAGERQLGVIEVDGVAGPWRLLGMQRDCPLRKAASYARVPLSSPDSPSDSR